MIVWLTTKWEICYNDFAQSSKLKPFDSDNHKT